MSKLRALVITQHLTALDLGAFPTNRFVVQGLGADAPVMASGNEDARASRRTQFTLFDCAGASKPAGRAGRGTLYAGAASASVTISMLFTPPMSSGWVLGLAGSGVQLLPLSTNL